ncbi:endonuclease/exonuclease/phosphatase family protein [Bacillus cereus]
MANISVGFFYNKSLVELAKKLVLMETNLILDGENNSLFDNTRKPLAAQFKFHGKHIVVVSTHLNSKLGEDSLFGKIQLITLKSEEKRMQLAEEVNKFVKGIQKHNVHAPVFVLSDMDNFEFLKLIQVLKGNIMKEMLETVPKQNHYPHIHDGNSQALNHIL